MSPPAQPKIYHITPVDKLSAILVSGGLISDATLIARGAANPAVGMSHIKLRRLELKVTCHPGTCVGQYVPFYFCPRSVMLYIIHRGNHPDVSYQGGQDPIIHLEADLNEVVAWAKANGRRWAFSLSNAGARYSEFRARLDELDQIDWAAVHAQDWRAVRDKKQAEFLLHEFFPWDLIHRIGVLSASVKRQTEAVLATVAHRPVVEVHRDWYY